MTNILLVNGRGVAIIDDENAELVASYRWRLMAGCYAATRPAPSTILYMHRLILDVPLGVQVDHINHNGLDNRRVNLRLATNGQNSANRVLGSDSRSGFKGVSWDAGRWRARIKVDQQDRHLGRFDIPEAAARAYDRAAREHFGEFAWLNFPGEEIA